MIRAEDMELSEHPDALLIAAAPTLLEACRRIVALFRDDGIDNDELAAKLGDAIEGRDPWLTEAISVAEGAEHA